MLGAKCSTRYTRTHAPEQRGREFASTHRPQNRHRAFRSSGQDVGRWAERDAYHAFAASCRATPPRAGAATAATIAVPAIRANGTRDTLQRPKHPAPAPSSPHNGAGFSAARHSAPDRVCCAAPHRAVARRTRRIFITVGTKFLILYI